MKIHKFDISGHPGETVGDITYRRLRGDIVHGRFRPGQKLKLDLLRKKYDISVTTLRELLSSLTSEGLVTAEGQRGFEVAPISKADLQDLADLRLLLETHALRQSIAAGDIEWEAGVVSSHYKLEMIERELIAGGEGPVQPWVRHDWDFHFAMIAACDKANLMRTHSSVFDRFMRYHMLILEFRGEKAKEDHIRLRDLVLARDADAAVELLIAHVQSGVDHILATGRIP